jgi:myosin heavy subunit
MTYLCVFVQIEQLTHAVHKLEAELHSIRHTHTQQLRTHESHRAALHTQLHTLTNDLSKRTALYAAQERRVFELQRCLHTHTTSHEKQLFTLQGQHTQLQSLYEVCTHTNTQLEMTVRELQQTVTAHTHTIAALTQSNIDLNGDLTDAHTQIESMQHMIDSLKGSDYETLTHTHMQTLESEKVSARTREAHVQTQLEECVRRLQEALTARDHAMQECAHTRGLLQDKEDLLRQVQQLQYTQSPTHTQSHTHNVSGFGNISMLHTDTHGDAHTHANEYEYAHTQQQQQLMDLSLSLGHDDVEGDSSVVHTQPHTHRYPHSHTQPHTQEQLSHVSAHTAADVFALCVDALTAATEQWHTFVAAHTQTHTQTHSTSADTWKEFLSAVCVAQFHTPTEESSAEVNTHDTDALISTVHTLVDLVFAHHSSVFVDAHTDTHTDTHRTALSDDFLTGEHTAAATPTNDDDDDDDKSVDITRESMNSQEIQRVLANTYTHTISRLHTHSTLNTSNTQSKQSKKGKHKGKQQQQQGPDKEELVNMVQALEEENDRLQARGMCPCRMCLCRMCVCVCVCVCAFVGYGKWYVFA